MCTDFVIANAFLSDSKLVSRGQLSKVGTGVERTERPMLPKRDQKLPRARANVLGKFSTFRSGSGGCHRVYVPGELGVGAARSPRASHYKRCSQLRTHSAVASPVALMGLWSPGPRSW